MKNEVAGIVFDSGRRQVVMMRRDSQSLMEFPGGETLPDCGLTESLSARYREETGLRIGPERWRKVARLDVRQDRRIHFFTAVSADEDFDMAGVFRLNVNDLPLMAVAAPALWLVFLARDLNVSEPVVVKRQ